MHSLDFDNDIFWLTISLDMKAVYVLSLEQIDFLNDMIFFHIFKEKWYVCKDQKLTDMEHHIISESFMAQ